MVSDTSPLTVQGGGERVLREHAWRLAARGHAVRVVSRGARSGRARLDGVEVREFPVDRGTALGFVRAAVAGARHEVAQALGEAGADVLQLHQPLSAWGALGAPAARALPSLYTFLSPAPLEYRSRRGMTGLHRSGGAGLAAQALLWLIERRCLRRATRIHVLSDFSARQLRTLYRIGGERVVKIPGGVDAARFRPVPDRPAARRALGLPEAAPLLFTLRNLEARMGLDGLIRAIAGARRHVPGLTLLVGGAGSLRAPLEALVRSLDLAGHVRFLGFVPEDALRLHYRAADVFLLPTRELEGFGLVTLEALACGTPVLGSRVGATPELLLPLDPGLLFDGPSPPAIEDAIVRFLARPDRAALEARCAAHAAGYAWDRVVERLEAELHRLAAGAPAGSPA